jgi:hypothetical protein
VLEPPGTPSDGHVRNCSRFLLWAWMGAFARGGIRRRDEVVPGLLGALSAWRLERSTTVAGRRAVRVVGGRRAASVGPPEGAVAVAPEDD